MERDLAAVGHRLCRIMEKMSANPFWSGRMGKPEDWARDARWFFDAWHPKGGIPGNEIRPYFWLGADADA